MPKRNLDLVGSLLIVLGIIGITLSAFADSIGVGKPGFGLNQSLVLFIGILLSTSGLLKVYRTTTKIMARILGTIYVSGLLYLCLMPYTCEYCKHIHNKILLNIKDFSWQDFAINLAAFIPVGYLLMLSFGSRQKDLKFYLFKRVIFVTFIGGALSLLLEVSQCYLIVGRKSSLYDLIANILGTCAGATMYPMVNQFKAPFFYKVATREDGNS